MHKSQGNGAAAFRGTYLDVFQPLLGEPPKADLFDGVDLTWNRVQGGAAVARILREAIRAYEPRHPAPRAAGSPRESRHGGRLLGLGTGARPLLRGLLGSAVRDAALVSRPRRDGEEGRAPLRAPRQGRLHLHGLRVLPPASRRRARSDPPVREPGRGEGRRTFPSGEEARRRPHLAAGRFHGDGMERVRVPRVADERDEVLRAQKEGADSVSLPALGFTGLG